MKGFFSILCIIAILPALAKEPGQVAVDFLEKVREGKVDLKAGADTALSPHITERKRKLIEESIEHLSSQIGKGKLIAGNVRLDGDFAAVMVTQGGEADQIKLQVYPVALVKGEDGWRAAPMLASFENAVSAYTVSLRERLSGLEAWMMQQRVLEIESLMLRSTEQMRQQIKGSFKTGDLTSTHPVKLLDRFQKAYAEGRQMEVLGYVGGYSENWPSDWEMRMEAIRTAFSAKARARHPWRLLSSPDVIRVVVDESVDDKEALISLACLDPAWVGENRDKESIQLIHFTFTKDEQGNWRLDLPESLLQEDNEAFSASQGLDDDLLEVFPERLRKTSPPQFAESFEKVEQEVIGLLEHGSVLELMRWVNFDRKSKSSRDACVLAAQDWWSIHSPGAFRSPVKMGSRVEGDWAVTVFHWFSLSQIEHVEMKPVFFRKVEKGWVWVPGSARNVDPKVGEIFAGWMKNEQAQWQANAMKNSLESIPSLARVDLEKNLEDAEIQELAKKWSAALEQNNIRGLFGMSARLGEDGESSHKLFRNLAYELSMAQRVESQITGIYRRGKWVAAGFAHTEGAEKVFSLMLAVSTDQGLKVLPEIDLISDSSRTRKFLNKVSLDRLKNYVSEAELEEIKGLFEEFEEKVR